MSARLVRLSLRPPPVLLFAPAIAAFFCDNLYYLIFTTFFGSEFYVVFL